MVAAGAPLPVGHPDRLDNVHPALRACWHPVCRSDDVADGAIVPVRLLGEDWAVLRVGAELTSFVDRCPHRMAPLSAGCVVDGELRCGYHGYRFSPTGACVAIPALGDGAHIPPRASLTMASGVIERYGLVWVAIEPPVADVIEVPEWDDPAYTVVPLPDLDWNAGAGQMTDNFLDLAHFPYLHAATFGDASATVVRDYRVDRDGFSFTTEYRHVTRHIGADGVGDDAVTDERSDTFVYVAPFSIRLRIEYRAEDVVLTIVFFHQPLDANTTRLYCFDLRNDIADGRTTADEAREFQLAVAAEDRALLERLADKSIPLDTQREVHTRADRITLEMRRIMADLVRAVADRPAVS
jgi:phenylpropionate dioxygenase-like ring-hydroxylating dioxygenase large terminal subunit